MFQHTNGSDSNDVFCESYYATPVCGEVVCEIFPDKDIMRLNYLHFYESGGMLGVLKLVLK